MKKVPVRKITPPVPPDTTDVFTRVALILDEVRRQTVRSINTGMVAAYWLIGREIVEAEQGGKSRAAYGTALLASLSKKLTARFGKGYSAANLANFRDFYRTYADRADAIFYTPGRKFELPPKKSCPVDGELSFDPNLGWSHYRALMRVERPEARAFYEQECATAGWSKRELERQIGSLHYERLLMSRDKKSMIEAARRPSPVAPHPLEILKDPYVLEFLDLPEHYSLNETELEEKLIAHLQGFLLELGHGFAFIGRQQRLTLDGDHFYADLVFYHVRLKCYIIIDLKTAKLIHGDLGQMQLYVNYYDEHHRRADDNPTLGLILCTDKNDSTVRYVLGKGQERIFASRYRMELPSEAELAAEVRRELALLSSESKPRRKVATPSGKSGRGSRP